MYNKSLIKELQEAQDRYNKSVLLDSNAAAERLFERHSEILTTHQSDLNVEFVNKITNG